MSNNDEGKDILQIFKTAVNNGQTRLALEALVDVIEAIVEVISSPEESVDVADVTAPSVPAEKVDIQQPKEEKPSSKKKAKEETIA